jgi:hypothetical protein
MSSIYEGPGFSDTRLLNLYKRSKGPIAYIDESYSAPEDNKGRVFYILSAIVIERSDIIRIRKDFINISPSGRWHSYELGKTAQGQKCIETMTSYLAENTMSIITVKGSISPEDPKGEAARRDCFTKLFQELLKSHIPKDQGLIVLERRTAGPQRQADIFTMDILRRESILSQRTLIFEGTPRTECLLWGPDAISWSTHRLLLKDEKRYIEKVTRSKNFKHVSA